MNKPVEVYDIEDLFKRYRRMIYAVAISISRNHSDAEDILQNVFLKISRNIKNFKGKSRISTWIYKIAYNEALMYLRKRYNKVSSGLFINWSELPDEKLLDNELKERINDAITHMPIKYRMPLLLHKVEGLSIDESSKVLDLKVGSLKTRLHRAYMIIKSEITDYFNDRLIKEKREKLILRCGIWTKFIYDYAKGNLDKKRNFHFQRHIQDCLSCKSFLDNYSQAISITRALKCQDLPPELQKRIDTFLLKAKK